MYLPLLPSDDPDPLPLSPAPLSPANEVEFASMAGASVLVGNENGPNHFSAVSVGVHHPYTLPDNRERIEMYMPQLIVSQVRVIER